MARTRSKPKGKAGSTQGPDLELSDRAKQKRRYQRGHVAPRHPDNKLRADMTRDELKAKFLEHYREKYNVSLCAALIGYSRDQIGKWRDEDAEFDRAVLEAHHQHIDLLEQSAMNRAVHGTLRPVFHMGEVCGEVNEFETPLTTFMLKHNRPEKFGERVEVTVTPQQFAEAVKAALASEDTLAKEALSGKDNAKTPPVPK